MRHANNRSNRIVRQFSPLLSADLVEVINDYHIHVDLPGVLPTDLDLEIAGGVLTIKAERRLVVEEDIGLTHNIERSQGKVERSITLPIDADADSAVPRFENGVLTVRFTKMGGSSRKKLLLA